MQRHLPYYSKNGFRLFASIIDFSPVHKIFVDFRRFS
ncbi:hypothetical protein I656_00862 [Geobacillus sp. WSUCF1]|nr:hypothetical protein I656_00862 [Geobacillus sp. WSUCF1]